MARPVLWRGAVVLFVATTVLTVFSCIDPGIPIQSTSENAPVAKAYEFPTTIPEFVGRSIEENLPEELAGIPNLTAIAKIVGSEEYEVIYRPLSVSTVDFKAVFSAASSDVKATWIEKPEPASLRAEVEAIKQRLGELQLASKKSADGLAGVGDGPMHSVGPTGSRPRTFVPADTGGDGGGGTPPPPPPPPQPINNVVIARIYLDSQYRSSYYSLTADLTGVPSEYLLSAGVSDLIGVGFNDCTSSYYFAPLGTSLSDGRHLYNACLETPPYGWSVQLYKDAGYGGCQTFGNMVPWIWDFYDHNWSTCYFDNMNDDLSSIRVNFFLSAN